MAESRWRPHLLLHLVTDAALCGPRGVEAVVAAAVRGGVTCVQLREKTLDTRPFVERARALKALLAPLGVPLIINDRLDVALASGADGVHVGQHDMRVDDVRRWLGPEALVGLSIESTGQLDAAEHEPVDYYGISPVFATPTKTDTAAALGLDGLAALRARTRRPLVAIGGIHVGNAPDVMAAGANGLAVVSALCAAPDPAEAARSLRLAMHLPLTA